MEDNNNPETKNEDPKKYIDFFIEQLDSTTALRDEMNKDYVEIRTDNIKQKRNFFQQLTVLSGAIIGLSSIFGHEGILNILYFRLGFFLNILFIIAVTLYFREILDKEGNDLLKQQDGYNVIFDNRIKIMSKYVENRSFTKKGIMDYLQETESSAEAKSIKLEVDKMNEDRTKRLTGKEAMDFSGELFVFLFVFASFFIFLSFFFVEINLYLLLSIIIFMIGLIFTDSVTFFVKKISKFLNFIKN
jgi:hypothetical protein